jgi:hypothetical protein
MNIYECLEKYKEITLQLIDKTTTGEDLQELINERSKIIDEIINVDFNEEELKEKVENFNILELDNELQTLVKKEKNKIRNQINMLRKNREARKNYNKINDNLKIFSAKG